MATAIGLTDGGLRKLADLRAREGHGTPGGAVTCVEIRKNTKAKAVSWLVSDAQVRKLGERTGLDTPVVLAVNDDH